MQKIESKFILYLIMYTLLAFYTSSFSPIFESTEARYAEIAREMVVSGNYLEPYFNGIKHFHKPPIAYWFIASGIKLFGIGNLGVRFFGIVSSIVTIIFTYKLSKFFLKDETEQYLPTLIMSSSFLSMAVSRIVSTDIYLTTFTIITQYFFLKQIYQNRSYINSVMIGLFLGLGFMTKGPIIFIFTLLPYLILKIFQTDFRNKFTWKEVLAGTFIFLSISSPWYILVIINNPDLLTYFLKTQTLDRVTTNRFNREQPFYFFFSTILLASLPYSIILFVKFKNLVSEYKNYLVTITYIVVPFIVFSIAKSKLHTYLAPLVPILSIFIYIFYKKHFSKLFNKIIMFLMLFLTFSLNFYIFYILKLKLDTFIIIISFMIFIYIYYLKKEIHKLESIFYISTILMLFFNMGYYLTSIFQEKFMGFENLIQITNKIDVDRKLEVLCYKRDLPSFSFYRNKLAVMAFGKIRETQFNKDNSYKKYYIDNEEGLQNFLNENEEFFLFTRGHLEEFKEKYKVTCEVKYIQRDYYLSLCKR